MNGSGTNVTVTMFGRIPPHQLTATAGTYGDTLVSTILF
jgi:spore coat protein U-like protein